MSKSWILLATAAALVACVTAAWAFTSGPSISTGSNPLRTLTVTGSWQNSSSTNSPMFQAQGSTFDVPQGQTFVITDLSFSGAPITLTGTNAPSNESGCTNPRLCILVDGAPAHCTLGNGGQQAFRTGLSIPSGSKVNLFVSVQVFSTSSCSGCPSVHKCTPAAVATGYLMKN